MLADTEDHHPAAQIAKRLHYRQMAKVVRLEQGNIANTESIINELKENHKKTLQGWQIAIIKTPHQAYSMEEDPILIANEQGIAKPLNEMSLIINAISDKPEHTIFLCIDHAIMREKNVVQLINKVAEYSV